MLETRIHMIPTEHAPVIAAKDPGIGACEYDERIVGVRRNCIDLAYTRTRE
jgi:hypothetical protein